MERLFALIGDAADPRVGGADTYIDRLNCKWTVSILIFCSAAITTKMFVFGSPVSCWCPAHFENSHCDFANKVSALCFCERRGRCVGCIVTCVLM